LKKSTVYHSGASIAKNAVAKGRGIAGNLALTSAVIKSAVKRDAVISGGVNER